MNKYKEIGLKLTPQRLAILNFLEGNTAHPSAEEIYKALSRSFPTMSLATVYNTLDSLKERGRLLELSIDPEKKRFDPNTKAHNHLICVRCKKIADIRETFDLGPVGDRVPDFEILGHHIEFYGICSACKKAAATEPSA